jgi:hypothetical protein
MNWLFLYSMNVTFSADTGLAYDYCHLLASLSDDITEKQKTLELRGDRDAEFVCRNSEDLAGALTSLMESSQAKVIQVQAMFKRSPLEYRFSFTIESRDYELPLKLAFQDGSVMLIYSTRR